MDNIISIDLPKTRIGGEYKLIARNKDGSIAKETDWFDNLILDSGLNYIFTGPSSATHVYRCHIGTGTAAPTNADTELSNQLLTSTSVTRSDSTPTGSPAYYTQGISTFRFSSITAGGITVSEVGISPYYTSGTLPLFSRALVQDSNGNPTSFSVTDQQILDVIYRLRNYPALISADYSQIVDINGTNHTFTWRAADAGVYRGGRGWYSAGTLLITQQAYPTLSAYSGSVGAITTFPSGTVSTASGAISHHTYVSGNFYREYTMRFGLNDANFGGGITAIDVEGRNAGNIGYRYQAAISPAIPKTAYDYLYMKVRLSAARY